MLGAREYSVNLKDIHFTVNPQVLGKVIDRLGAWRKIAEWQAEGEEEEEFCVRTSIQVQCR